MHPEKCKKIWKKISSPSRLISSIEFGCEFGDGILGSFDSKLLSSFRTSEFEGSIC